MGKEKNIRIEGKYEDPSVQKGLLCKLFEEINQDIFVEWSMKNLIKGSKVLNLGEYRSKLKAYLMNLYEEVCSECKAPFSKKFYEKTFDIWWEDGLEKALETNY